MKSTMLNRLALPFLILAVFTAGCDTVDETPIGDPDPDPASVFIANQGNFADGNGSVTRYDAETGDVERNAISGLNTIIQSLLLEDNELYIASNTAGRVEVFETSTLEQMAQVSDIEGPRYMARASLEKLYVTQTGSFDGETGFVSIVDLMNDDVSDQIEIGGNPEGIAVAGNMAFVATGAFGVSSDVVLIELATDEVVQTVDVECETPRDVFGVADAFAIVACTGNDDTNGALRVLNESGEIVDEMDLDERLTSGTSGAVAYFAADVGEFYGIQADNTLIRVPVSADGVIGSPEAIGPLEGPTPGTVAYDPVSEQIYVGRPDADDPFTSSGFVTVHDRDGQELSEFDAGVAPAHIVLSTEN